MTSEIKQRIEQIRRGEVPEEYKKIHGDIVPLTWEHPKVCVNLQTDVR